MHIVQLYKDYFPVIGGIENHLRDLSAGLAERGHRVTVLVTNLANRTEIERPLPGLTVIKAARALHLASTPLSVEMLRLARRLRADVVHLHFPYPLGDLAYLAMPERAPLIVTYHSDIVRQRVLLRAYGPLLGRTLRSAARIIATSPNYIASSPYLRPHAAKCAVIPLGIDAERFVYADHRPPTTDHRPGGSDWGLGTGDWEQGDTARGQGSGVWGLGSGVGEPPPSCLPPQAGGPRGVGVRDQALASAQLKTQNSKLKTSPQSPIPNPQSETLSPQSSVLSPRYPDLPLLLFVGRLRYYKGLHVLLDALPAVRANLLIAGSGPERARLAAQAARLGIASRVHFLGDIADDDLPALYRAADVFVMPAHLRAEALGLAQIEALASGVPCVSTELGTGTSYANRHGETGLVVAPGDPAALAHAINTLLADPELRRRFGAAGRRRVMALFTRERMLDGVEAVYRDTLTAPGKT